MSAPPPFPAGATLGEVGEFALIAEISRRLEQGAAVYVGPGDDAAVLRAPKGHVVVSTDLLVEGRHFRRDWAEALPWRSESASSSGASGASRVMGILPRRGRGGDRSPADCR